MKIKTAVVGATGWTGGELIRLLIQHPNIESVFPVSRQEDIDLEIVHPNLSGSSLNTFTLDEVIKMNPDVVFISLPSGQAHEAALKIAKTGAKMIDLGADFRFEEPAVFEQVYGKTHQAKKLQNRFTYGFIEEYREEIVTSEYIANPGCYVNAALCGLIPFVRAGFVDSEHVFISAINGTSGAGSDVKKELHHYHQFGNVLAYSLNGHRHTKEIELMIEKITGNDTNVSMTTSHGNFSRGIFMIQAVKLNPDCKKNREELLLYLADYYKDDPFISIVGRRDKSEGIEKNYGIYPQLSKVIGSNACHISIDIVEEKRELRIVSVIDNLVKGAAGTAIQNMNLMFNFPETTGLSKYGL